MTDLIHQASQQLLGSNALTVDQLQAQLHNIMRSGADSADIYCQFNRHESWGLEDGIVKHGNHGIEQGAGIRALQGEKTGFAYVDDITLPSLEQAGGVAAAIVRQGQSLTVPSLVGQNAQALYPAIDPIDELDAADKVAVLQQVEADARAADPRVVQVMANLVAAQDVIMVVASDGTLAADIRPLTRLSVTVVVEENGRREQASSGGGGRYGLQTLVAGDQPARWAREAVRQATVNLAAQAAPAGTMPVVLGPGWPGVLLHEAVGHGLEADFNRKGTSTFAGRLGELVANPLVTVVDDGTLDGRRGSLSIDDEGVASQNTILIENGRLAAYMQDKHNAGLMGMPVTGNGRRESYAHLPMPRMTNTYMLPGESAPDEIIATIDKGLYAVNFGGGQVDITSGNFTFSASEAYWVENGKVQYPVKGATLVGSGPDVMQKISMVGNDLALDEGVGVCGKDGQSVPVGVGQPTLKIDEITVGGTQVNN
jgi:TldD protein